MKKTVLVLAAVAMLGLSGAAFAESAAPAMKERVQPTQTSVTHQKRLSHRVGKTKHAVAYHHNRHHQVRQASHHVNGKKSLSKHATAHKRTRTKASS